MNDIDLPLISINIPTYNEEKHLPLALKSLSKQNYPNLEIIIIDSNSKDKTRQIALDYGAKVINYPGKLLGARYVGINESHGDYILFLDADQIIKKTAIRRAVEKIQNYDMLILEEDSYKPHTFVEKQISKEKKILHNDLNALDPIQGGLLPRFFKKKILIESFKSIPDNLFPIVVSQDHAIIYFEAYKLSNQVSVLEDAVSHIEPSSIIEILKHYYRFGKSTRKLARTGYYKNIFKEKNKASKNFLKSLKNDLIILNISRGVAFRLGYYMG